MAVIPYLLRESKVYFTHPHYPINGECTDFVLQYGSKFSALLFINNAAFTTGTNISFVWGTFTVNLPLVASLTTYNLGAEFSADELEFILSAAGHQDLNNAFDFSLNYHDMTFTVIAIQAKEIGAQYNLAITHSTGAAGYISSVTAVDTILNNALSVQCDIFKQDWTGSTWIKLGVLNSALKYDQYYLWKMFSFDMAEFLHRHLSCDPINYLDYYNNGLFTQCFNSVGDFKFGLRQNLLWSGSFNIEDETVLRGGLTQRDYIIWRTDYWGRYPDGVIWRLTNYVKYVGQYQIQACEKQKLYSTFFHNSPTPDDFSVDIVITDINDNVGSVTIWTQIIPRRAKVILNYSFYELGIDGLATSVGLGVVKSWLIKLTSVSTSDVFYIDHRVFVEDDFKQQFFIYENSLGGMVTLRTVGEYETGVEISKAEFAKEFSIPSLYVIDEVYMVQETYNNVFGGSCFSGWLDKTDTLNFIDFLNSENVWLQDDDAMAMKPIKILKGSWQILKKSINGVTQYGYKFDYTATVKNKHVTDIIPY